MIKDDTNHSAKVDHSDLTDAEREKRGMQTMSETTTETTKPKRTKAKASKPKAAAKPKTAKAKAKPEKTKAQLAWAEKHVTLTEKQQAEPREVVRLLPAVLKMAETYRTSTKARKERYETNSQVIEHMLVKSFNRQAALDRYNGEESKLVN